MGLHAPICPPQIWAGEEAHIRDEANLMNLVKMRRRADARLCLLRDTLPNSRAFQAGNYLYHHHLATLYPEPDDKVHFFRRSQSIE